KVPSVMMHFLIADIIYHGFHSRTRNTKNTEAFLPSELCIKTPREPSGFRSRRRRRDIDSPHPKIWEICEQINKPSKAYLILKYPDGLRLRFQRLHCVFGGLDRFDLCSEFPRVG